MCQKRLTFCQKLEFNIKKVINNPPGDTLISNYLFIYQHIPADYAQSFNTSCHRFIPIIHHNKNYRH